MPACRHHKAHAIHCGGACRKCRPNLIAFSTPLARAMPSLPKRNACVSLCRCPSLLKSGGISRMLPFSKERSPFCALHAIIFFGASMRRTRTFCTFARQLAVVAPSGCSAQRAGTLKLARGVRTPENWLIFTFLGTYSSGNKNELV